MNSINLVISGNLTGFSRFYATPSANDILNDAKFDFDYRNFLTFLNSDDKAYAISFAPSVLAVSLVSRILDSFRRPGVLVVTILLPRKSKVESTLNPQNKNALYQLLNEIYNKFHDKNFINGMLNQNAAVLMQDYYTEILANYVLVSDGLQRNINTTIEVTSPNKRLGYVQTSEDNVPLYLESPCRRSFEGCHHIFFAQNPVQNLIAEEPVEVVYYRVHITNNSQTLPSVTLNDRIPNIRPDEGEVDIEKNFTYQQVIDGDALPYIRGEQKGDVIELTYRFEKEHKTIHFIFKDGVNEIPFDQITLDIVDKNGFPTRIPTNPYTFEGKELYEGVKTLQCSNENYVVKQESKNIDLGRYENNSTLYVQIEPAFRFEYNFGIQNQSKTIVFTNQRSKKTLIYKDVKQFFSELLPGHPEEWFLSIKSNYYDDVSEQVPSSGQKITIILKPKSLPQHPNNSGKTVSKQKDLIAETKQTLPTITSSASKKHDGRVHLNPTATSDGKNKKNKLQPFLIVGACIIVILLAFLLLNVEDIIDHFSSKQNENVVDVEDEDKTIDKDVIVSFLDASNDVLVKDNEINFEIFNKYVSCVVSPDEKVDIDVMFESVDTIQYKYHLSGLVSDNRDFEFSVFVSDKGRYPQEKHVIGKRIISSNEICESENPIKIAIPLNINTSNLKRFVQIVNINDYEISDNVIQSLEKKIKNDKIPDEGFKVFMLNRISHIKPKVEVISHEEKPKEDKKKDKQNGGGLNGDLGKLKNYIKDVKYVPNSYLGNLSDEQRDLIKTTYHTWIENVYNNKSPEQKDVIKQEITRKCFKFKDLSFIINKYKGN